MMTEGSCEFCLVLGIINAKDDLSSFGGVKLTVSHTTTKMTSMMLHSQFLKVDIWMTSLVCSTCQNTLNLTLGQVDLE